MRALSLLAACAAAVLLLAEPAAGSIADTIKELAQLRDQASPATLASCPCHRCRRSPACSMCGRAV